MFEAITIRRVKTSPDNFNIGAIAEALLFYQSAHLVFDYLDLFCLVRQIGLENLWTLLSVPSVKATYIANGIGTSTSVASGSLVHQFAVTDMRDARTGRAKPRKILAALLASGSNSSRRTRVLVQKTMERIRIQELDSTVGAKNELDFVWQATADLDDSKYVNDLVFITLRKLVPELKIEPSWRFEVISRPPRFEIRTNIDFDLVNRVHDAMGPEEKSAGGYRALVQRHIATNVNEGQTSGMFDVGYEASRGGKIDEMILINSVLDTRLLLMLAFENMTELMTSPADAKMMRLRLAQILARRDKSEQEMDLFRQLVFPDGRSLGDAMNSGERSVSELVGVIERAAKFRQWLATLHPDDKLVSEYLKAVSATSWVDRLPPKSLRFAFFTGAGILADLLMPTGIGTAAGVGIGASDTFLLDKIVKGWKPSQFIEGPVREFVVGQQ